MARPTAPTKPGTDPLADLRPADDSPAGPPQPEVADQVVEIRPMASQEVHDAMRAEIVVAYHGDTVAAGTLHKGGVCACRYLATLAVRTILGVPVEPQEVQADLEPTEPSTDA
jgi:hypothetical protein